MKWYLNQLRRAIGEILYDPQYCCGNELAKLEPTSNKNRETYIILRVVQDCCFDKTKLVEVHDICVTAKEPNWDELMEDQTIEAGDIIDKP